MSLLLIIVVLIVLFGFPYGGYRMGYNRPYGNGLNYGYHGGGIGLILAIVVIWFLFHGHYL
jgi:hypothetical protein